MKIDINVNQGFVDIAAEGYDAGVRLGETVAQDVMAVRMGPDMRMAVVGSPAYFATRSIPRKPQDLSQHNCINLRSRTDGGVYVWEFEKSGRPINVRVEGQCTVNDIALMRLRAIRGPVSATLRRGGSSVCLLIGARPFPGIISITQAAASSPPPLRS